MSSGEPCGRDEESKRTTCASRSGARGRGARALVEEAEVARAIPVVRREAKASGAKINAEKTAEPSRHPWSWLLKGVFAVDVIRTVDIIHVVEKVWSAGHCHRRRRAANAGRRASLGAGHRALYRHAVRVNSDASVAFAIQPVLLTRASLDTPRAIERAHEQPPA